MHASEAAELLAPIVRQADAAGLDVAAAFPVDLYNDRVAERYHLPTFGRQRPLGVVVGNSRALWPVFLGAVREHPGLREVEHPLNAYVTEAVRGLLAEFPTGHEIRWAHDAVPSPVAIQHAAHLAGLAHLSPSYLCIHPVHGPWIGLRAVVVLDADWQGDAPPPAPDPCTPCEKPCMTALEEAMAAGRRKPSSEAEAAGRWRLWLAVRDVCPMGRASRYDEDQCEYHYLKDRTSLLRVVESGGRA